MSVVIRHFDGGAGGDVCVAGPRTRALFKRSHAARAIIVEFEAGWTVPLLGIAAHALTDQIVPLEEMWGRRGAALRSEVLRLPEADRAAAAVLRAMMENARSAPVSSSVQIARRASRLLEVPGAKVGYVARMLGVTDRHLRRAFRDGIGVSPKQFSQAARLGRAARMARSVEDWTSVAAATGYSDQSHLITEFRRFTGLTPAKFKAVMLSSSA